MCRGLRTPYTMHVNPIQQALQENGRTNAHNGRIKMTCLNLNKNFLRAKNLHKQARALCGKGDNVNSGTLDLLQKLAVEVDKYLTCDNESCGKGTTSGVGTSERPLKLKVCGGCKQAHYCSVACQQEDWKTRHKHVCKRTQRSK